MAEVLRFPAPQPAPPVTERTDDELMLLARAGSRDAFGVLVGRYLGKLRGFCAKLICDARAGEEIAQETWLQIWSYRQEYRAEGRFPVLLYTTARNRCRNHLRDTQRRGRWVTTGEDTDTLPEVASLDGDHLGALLDRERQRQVLDALARLPEKLREALVLRFSEDLGYDDMARVLDTSESTLRSRVHHGLKRLRAEMEPGR